MIEPQLVEQVERLLAEGKLSYRKIARFTGVSRGTIGAIASGRRRIQPRRMFFWEEEPMVPDVPPQRCPQCGGMVYMPCRLCRTRKEMAKLPDIRALIRANAYQPFMPLGLNLKPVHQQRYEEVRRWRVALAEPVALKREQREGSGFGVQGSELKCEVKS
jgi:transcriptional regulator with XRE-family HTH domain